MQKLNTTDSAFYALAKKGGKERKEVIKYYKRAIRIANYNKQPIQDFKKMLTILHKLELCNS